MNKVMLTTFDNPFDPFTQFEDWWAYDIQKGYYCCSLLARSCPIAENLPEEEAVLSIEQAIDDIVKNDSLGLYIKVKQTDKN